MKTIPLILSLLLFTGAALAFSPATDSQQKSQGLQAASTQADAPKEKVIAAQLPSYPLTTCAVSGEELGSMGEVIDVVTEGRLIRICCKGCAKSIRKDPKKAIAKIDEAVIAQQSKIYPFEICVVSNEPLDANGKPKDVVYGTRLARFCCGGCAKAFKKNPDKFMAKVDKGLIEKQLASYPLEECLVSGEELGSGSSSFLYGTRLVRTCCKRCQKAFKKNPTKYVARLDSKK